MENKCAPDFGVDSLEHRGHFNGKHCDFHSVHFLAVLKESPSSRMT